MATAPRKKASVERITLASASDVKLPVEFKKATGAIHIAPKSRITLVQRKAFNLLLANALHTHEHLDETSYSISLSYLIKELEFDSNNTAYVKAALKQLNVLQVQWEAIDENGRDKWGVATLIAEAEIVDGRVFYSFASRTKQMLLDPEFYGRINLEIQKQFQSQYAYALYENCVRFVDVGKTSMLKVAQWRDLLNALGDYYNEFKNFSRKVLKPAIEEVNEVSDINIKATYVYEGKSVTHLQFLVERKRQTQMLLPVNIPIDARLEKKLLGMGMNDSQIADILNSYEIDHVWSTVAQFEETLATSSKPIKSKVAYFRTMLKNNEKRVTTSRKHAAGDKPAPADPANAQSAPENAKTKTDAGRKKNLGMEELQIEFSAHRRARAEEIYQQLHADEQEALRAEFEHKSGQPTAILSSYRKSGLRSKLVSTAFQGFLQKKLLTEPSDTDLLQFVVTNGLVSR